MVEALQRECVEVGVVAADVQLGYLALAVRKVLHARHPAIEQDHALLELFSRVHHDLVGRLDDDFAHRPADRLFLFRAEPVPPAHLLQMRFNRHFAAVLKAAPARGVPRTDPD